jgi:hypothetical protein
VYQTENAQSKNLVCVHILRVRPNNTARLEICFGCKTAIIVAQKSALLFVEVAQKSALLFVEVARNHWMAIYQNPISGDFDKINNTLYIF